MTNASAVDAIVIGGGHNGLVCASHLARAGRKVLLLERRASFGGMAASLEFAPGFRASVAHRIDGLHPSVARGLDLPVQPRSDSSLGIGTIWSDGERDVRHIPDAGSSALPGVAGLSKADVAALEGVRTRLQRLTRPLAPLLQHTPVQLSTSDWKHALSLLRIGLGLFRLGRRDLRDLLRIAPMSAADFVSEVFGSEPLRSLLASEAVRGGRFGPRAPGTVLPLLYRAALRRKESDRAPRPRSGRDMPSGSATSVVERLEYVAHRAGVELVAESTASSLMVEDGKVVGVRLTSGEERRARIVASSLDAKTTLLGLLGERHLDADLAQSVRRIPAMGMAAKVHLALDRLPKLHAFSSGRYRILVARNVAAIETAYDEVKYGNVPNEPVLEAVVASAHDASLAPAGKAVVSVLVHPMPFLEDEAAWMQARDRVAQSVVNRLDACVPELKDSIVAVEVRGPREIARDFGSEGGHWHQVEFTLDRAFMLRPLPGWSRYRGPIDNLYLCGASCHPGGDVTGLPGANAAREILRDLSTGRSGP